MCYNGPMGQHGLGVLHTIRTEDSDGADRYG